MLSIPSAVKQSTLWALLIQTRAELSSAAEESSLTRAGQYLRRVTIHSWLYRWLTKEPEPDVIVIDLRETWTVGPILEILERVGTYFHQAYQDSRTQTIAQGTTTQFREQPVRLLSAVVIGFAVMILVPKILSGGISMLVLIGTGVILIGGIIGLFVDLSLDELVETKPVQILLRVLEPPEPPES